MTPLLLALLVIAAGDGGPTDAPVAARVTPAPHATGTACASCHVTASWKDVRFNHERTGFPLTGRHARTTCKACHSRDFTTPVPRTCSGCHTDVHAGELGARCESCHDTTDWRSRFDADAHRRTAFPLVGAHAAIPCTECHAEARERRFSRAAVDCLGCHQAQAQRTVAPVDHTAGGLGLATQACQSCHLPTRWAPARFTTHDACFPISAGAHAGVPCLSCHATLTRATAACRTNTATRCVDCHTNARDGKTGSTDAQHDGVPGYAFAAAKCAQCHANALPGAGP